MENNGPVTGVLVPLPWGKYNLSREAGIVDAKYVIVWFNGWLSNNGERVKRTRVKETFEK